jgi:hypothetical protein
MLIYRNSKNQNNTLKGEKERTITASFYTTSKMLWVFSCCHPSVDTMENTFLASWGALVC